METLTRTLPLPEHLLAAAQGVDRVGRVQEGLGSAARPTRRPQANRLGGGDRRRDVQPRKKGGAEVGNTKKGKGTKGCILPEGTTNKSVTLSHGCKVEITSDLTFEGGATLTIEPGVELRFATERYLAFRDVKLVVKCTEKEPVVFTST